MGQQIALNINANDPYTRYVTGQNTAGDIDEKDDTLVISFTVPEKRVRDEQCRVSYGESASTPWSRWPTVSVDGGEPVAVNAGFTSGSIYFRVGEPHSDEEFKVAPGSMVKIVVAMHDPAKHPTGPYDAPKTMYVDWQPFA